MLPRAWTAADFSSIKLTSTSIPTRSASSSLSVSSENASFYFCSISSLTPAVDLQDFMISSSTGFMIGSISDLRILASSAKYEIAVSLSSNLSSYVKNFIACCENTSMQSAGNFSLPTAEANYPAHMRACPFTESSEFPAFGFTTVSYKLFKICS